MRLVYGLVGRALDDQGAAFFTFCGKSAMPI
jgi:hypothetical protein